MRIAGAHVIVTGASRGIGREVAKELAGRGARVTLVARDKQRITDLGREIDAAPLPTDLSVADEVAALIPTAESLNGPVDVLINNAAMMASGALVHIDPARLRSVINTNLIAPFDLAARVLPSMLERRQGMIVNVTSLAGDMALRNVIPYVIGKSGLSLGTHTLRRELRGTGVRTMLLVLGILSTDLVAEANNDPVTSSLTPRLAWAPPITTAGIASGLADAIEKNRQTVVMPPVLAPLHYVRLLPTKAADVLMIGIQRSLP